MGTLASPLGEGCGDACVSTGRGVWGNEVSPSLSGGKQGTIVVQRVVRLDSPCDSCILLADRDLLDGLRESYLRYCTHSRHAEYRWYTDNVYRWVA